VLCVAKSGTALDCVISINKDPNYQASKLQELTIFVNKIFKSYLEKDPATNKNDKHFPFPLKEDVVRNAVDRLTYQDKITIEIKSDPILFCTINDLLWDIFFKNKSSKTYDNFLSFHGWIGTKVFNTTNLLACKINAIKAIEDKKRKREDGVKKQPQQQKMHKNNGNSRDTFSAGRGAGRGGGGRGTGCGEGTRQKATTLPPTAAAASTTRVVSPLNWSQSSQEAKKTQQLLDSLKLVLNIWKRRRNHRFLC
jgi:hypothetical protein